jgi:hypothetical protein
MTKVNAILEVPYIEGTPARADHRNGIVYISKKHFEGMDPVYKDFIIAHEEGHLVLNTKNEEQADEYAMKKLLKQGYPLSKILGSLTQVLQYDKMGHYGRTNAIFNKLFLYDLAVNQNKKLLNHLNLLNMNTPDELTDIYAASYETDYSDFLGLGKAAKERRKQKQEMKKEKKHSKVLIRMARAEKEKAKADAIREGRPVEEGGAIKNILAGAGKLVGGILGKPTEEEDQPIEKSSDAEQPDKKDKKNNKTWIIIAVVVVILIIAAYFIFFRGKKGKK